MTSQSTEDFTIPDDLADTLRRVAIGVPGGPPELAEVHRRRRHGELRRSTAALAGVGVVVAASMAAPHLLSAPVAITASAAPVVTSDPTPTTPPAPPAQRMFLAGSGFIRMPIDTGATDLPGPDPALPNFGYPAGAAGLISTGSQEVTADGSVVSVDLPGDDRRGFLPLADGRSVTLEWQSLSEAPRRDGPCITDAALYLRIYQADGTMSLSRDVRARCETTSLVGASDTEVFLIRTPHDEQNQRPISGRRLVAHNLADGSERTVAGLDGISPGVPDMNIEANLNAGRLVAVPTEPGCRIEVLDTASGELTTLDLADDLGECYYVDRLRLSPNGDLLALAYTTGGEQPYDVMFAVIDLTGRIVRLTALADSMPPADLGAASVLSWNSTGPAREIFPATFAAGLAWTDDATVRVGWARPPSHLDRVVGIEEVLEVQTYSVP